MERSKCPKISGLVYVDGHKQTNRYGEVTVRYNRLIQQYGPIQGKGFKQGIGVTLRVQKTGGSDRRMKDNEKQPRCDVSIVSVAPDHVFIKIRTREIPEFVENKLCEVFFDEQNVCSLDKSKNFDHQIDLYEELLNDTIPSASKSFEIDGPLRYILECWGQTGQRKSKTKPMNPNRFAQNLTYYGIRLSNPKINGSQGQAFLEAMKMFYRKTPPITIIHGPPGTGKSTVTAEIIYQIDQKYPSNKILVLAPSHVAVDGLVRSVGMRSNEIGIHRRVNDLSKITDDFVKLKFCSDVPPDLIRRDVNIIRNNIESDSRRCE